MILLSRKRFHEAILYPRSNNIRDINCPIRTPNVRWKFLFLKYPPSISYLFNQFLEFHSKLRFTEFDWELKFAEFYLKLSNFQNCNWSLSIFRIFDLNSVDLRLNQSSFVWKVPNHAARDTSLYRDRVGGGYELVVGSREGLTSPRSQSSL